MGVPGIGSLVELEGFCADMATFDSLHMDFVLLPSDQVSVSTPQLEFWLVELELDMERMGFEVPSDNPEYLVSFDSPLGRHIAAIMAAASSVAMVGSLGVVEVVCSTTITAVPYDLSHLESG